MSGMSIDILPALEDNYMYLVNAQRHLSYILENEFISFFQLVDNQTNDAAIIDPVEPDKVLAAVEKRNVNLKAILTTHHHWDHAGGNEGLVAKFTGNKLTVYGGDDRIDALTDKVQQDTEILTIGNLKIRCLFTPCHTTGHICFYVEAPSGDKCVFTGNF